MVIRSYQVSPGVCICQQAALLGRLLSTKPSPSCGRSYRIGNGEISLSNILRKPSALDCLPHSTVEMSSVPYFIVVDNTDKNVTVDGANITSAIDAYDEYHGSDTTVDGEHTQVTLEFWGI